mgnify:CR=1 FL=1
MVCASKAKAMKIIIEKASSDEPPYDMKGNVIPVTGKTPQTTPQFIKDCMRMLLVSPKAKSAENLFLLSIIKV